MFACIFLNEHLLFLLQIKSIEQYFPSILLPSTKSIGPILHYGPLGAPRSRLTSIHGFIVYAMVVAWYLKELE